MIKHTTLPNGIRVISETVTFVRSVSIGIYIKNGSIDESALNNGISHFLEHMFFKGTPQRSARDLADFMSRIGGQINAYTSKEYVCFYAHVLDTYLEDVIRMFADMLTHSNLYEEDIEKEKAIILEEYQMYEDNPEELVMDEIHTLVWPDHAIGYNIIGTKDTIKQMEQATLRQYLSDHYVGERIIVSVVGKINEAETLALLTDVFQEIPIGKKESRNKRPVYKPGKRHFRKDIEQGHILMSYPTVDYHHKDSYAMNAINTVLGGSMNSRLFQHIREELGLAYSIFSYMETFDQAGLLNIYAATNVRQMESAIEAINEEIKRFSAEGMKDSELADVKEQIKSNLIIGMENMGTRMTHYAKGELLLGHIREMDEMIRLMDSVNMNDMRRLIETTFSHPASIVLASPDGSIIERL